MDLFRAHYCVCQRQGKKGGEGVWGEAEWPRRDAQERKRKQGPGALEAFSEGFTCCRDLPGKFFQKSLGLFRVGPMVTCWGGRKRGAALANQSCGGATPETAPPNPGANANGGISLVRVQEGLNEFSEGPGPIES